MRDEKNLLVYYAMAKIHGSNAKELIPGYEESDKIADVIKYMSTNLIGGNESEYKILGMADGPATANKHFQTLQKLAEQFVAEKYPQFAGKGRGEA